jgi:tetratricopeptide (TPR) repeat protein
MRAQVNITKHQEWLQKFLLLMGKLMAFLVILLLFALTTNAQRTAVYDDEIRFYNRGLELFEKEKFAAAQKHFTWFSGITKDPQLKINSTYYAATCAMELFNPDAEPSLITVIQKYPENPKAKLAKFQLGRFYYRNKNNKEAVKWLSDLNPEYLSNTDQKEYYFTLGYCQFKSNLFKESKNSFKVIKDEKSKFYDATNYYYGYVCYQSGDFNEALEHFGRIKYHKTFGPLASVYIAQIYFSRKQFKEVINYCDTITNKDLAIDVAGMLGQSHYNIGNYSKAIPYLEQFMKDAPVMPKNNDYFQLAYSYYKNQQYNFAIEQLLKIENPSDSIKQSSLFTLADSYLKTDKKANAIAAFDQCYAADSSSKMAEEALYFSAKISDEMNVQGSAMTKYVKYLEQFPESDYIDEVRSNLGSLLLNARNYKEAIRILESLKNPGKTEKTMLQRVLYYRAEELYLNNLFPDALKLFNKALEINNDPYINGLSHFWLAEISYKNGKYKEALSSYQKAQSFTDFKSTRFYPLSFYESGYSNLKIEDYNAAVESFKEYVKLDPGKASPEVYTDAVIRIADCYFVSRKYDLAIEYYDKVVSDKLNGSDYALYQKSLILGVQNKYKEKGAVLKTLISMFPKSIYIDDAVFENANLYLLSEEYPSAINEFNLLITNYPRSIYIRKARLSKALALFNAKMDDEVLAEVKVLITDYPNSEEAKEGLVIVKNLLVNKGESDAYLDYIKVLPNIVVSASSQDSLSYEAAFNLYKVKDYTKATKSFGNYINKFPGGYFILKANYFKAESESILKNHDAALINYEYVANALRSDFTERSTRQAATIHYMKKNYDAAYTYYSALERIASLKDNLMVSILGQMRCSNLQGKSDSAAVAAFKYINSGIGLKEQLLEAHIIAGRFYMNRSKLDSAQIEFAGILRETKNVYGAESKYNLAYIQFLRKEYKTAQKTIYDLADQFSAYEFWVAKAYLLLADILIKQNDFFQAKATLQSLIDNYEGQDILTLAKQKLIEVNDLENQQKDKQKQQIEQRIKQNENK